MKKIRKISENPLVIFLVLFNFVFVSCSSEDLSTDLKKDSSKNSYNKMQADGEGLFRQVFFLQGGEQNILKELQYYDANILTLEKLSLSQKEQREKFVDEVINIIKKSKPNYFADFQKTIASDDPYEIDNALKNGSHEIFEATEKSSYGILFQNAKSIYEKKYGTKKITSQEEFDKIKDEIAKKMNLDSSVAIGESGKCIALAAAAAVAVAAVALETIAVANMIVYLSVFVKVKGKLWSAIDDSIGKSSLMNEEIVLKLIENY